MPNLSSKRGTLAGAVSLVAIVSSATSALAADQAWSGLFSNNYSDILNWGTFTPAGSGDRAIFSAPTAPRSLIVFQSSVNVQNVLMSGTTLAGDWSFVSSGPGNGITIANSLNLVNAVGNSFLTITSGMGLSSNTIDINTGCGIGIGGAATSVFVTNQFTTNGNGTLAVTSGATAAGYMDLASTGLMSVNSATMNAHGLEMRGGGNFEIQNGGVFNLSANNFGLTNDASIRVGTLKLLAGGTLNFTGTRRLEVSDSGNFELTPGWEIPNTSTVRAVGGGDIIAHSYFDVGNNGTGTLLVDGGGSSFTSQTSTCDWGSNTGNADVQVSTGAIAQVAALNVAVSNGIGIVNILSSGQLSTTGALNVGGGATARTVQINASGGTLTAGDLATFNNQAALSLGASGSGGAINFNNGATFNAGSRFDWFSGNVSVASGKTLAVNGGIVNVTAGGRVLSNGSTLSIGTNGTYTTNNFLDIANAGGAATGTLIVSGTGAVYTTGTTYSDIGKNTNNTAVVTVASGGVANFNAGLDMAVNGGTATLNINAGGTFSAAVRFNAGGTVAGTNANVNVAGGTLNLNTDASIAKGGKLNWSSGTLVVASGKTLDVNGGLLALTVAGTAQPSGSTFRIRNAGTFTTTNYFDTNNATLLADGLNTTVNVNGTNFADWGNGSGQTANVTVSTSAAVFYNKGLSLGRSGGNVVANLNSNGLVRAVGSPLSMGGSTGAVAVTLYGGILSTTGSGGVVTLGQGTTINLNSGAVIFDGSLTMNGNAKIIAASDNNLRTLASGNLNVAATAKIDLGNTPMTVDYTAGSQIDYIRGLILIGRSGGTWTGNGITSSFVAADPRLAVAYLDDGNAVQIGIAIGGDANISGMVEFQDLVTLAQHYNQTGSYWQDGDFTFDGLVSFPDLVILAQNYNLALVLTQTELTTLGGADFAADWALAQSLVPEPTTLATLAIGAIAAARRGNRRASAR